jgi:serine/threonine protein kinase
MELVSRSGEVIKSNDVDRFERKEKLGEGTYGIVYKAVDK